MPVGSPRTSWDPAGAGATDCPSRSIILTIVVWIAAIGLIIAPRHGNAGVVTEQFGPRPLFLSLKSLDMR